MRRKFLTTVAGGVCRHPWWLVLPAVVAAVVAGLYTAARLEFKTSRNDLIGRDSEYWRLYSEYAREFRDEEDYLLVVESNDPSANRQVVDALAAALLSPSNNPHPADSKDAQQFVAEDLFYRVRFDAMQERYLYFLSTNELIEIRDAIKDFQQLVAVLQANPRLSTFFDAMRQMLEQMAVAPPAERKRMEAFLPTVTAIVRQLATREQNPAASGLLSPWANAFFSEEMLGEARQQMQWEGYNAFANGRMFLLLVHPRGPGDGPSPHEATVAKLRRILAEVAQQNPDVRISLTGEPVLDLDEMLQSQRDATWATLLTLVLIGLLFAFSFHEIWRPVLATVCLMLIVALSMGWATLAVGHLNLITVTFAVMILGLSVDLGIQIIARYEEELARGVERCAAMRAAIEQTGPSIITAALTNAAAFLAMGLSGFRGVIELGVIAAGGMVLALGVMLFVLPALIIAVRPRQESTFIPARVAARWFGRQLHRHPWLIVALCTIVTGVAGWGMTRVRFDYNVLNLQSRGLESVEVEKRLLGSDAHSTIFAAVVASDLAETRRLHAALEQHTNEIISVASIAPLLPEQQEEKAAIIRQIQARLDRPKFALSAESLNFDELTGVLRSLELRARDLARDAAGHSQWAALTDALRQARTRLAAATPAMIAQLSAYERRFFADLEAQLAMMATQVTDRPMTLADVPPELRSMLMNKDGTKFLLRVFPRENIWDREPLVRFVRAVQTVAPQATGTPLGIYEFVDILQKGYLKAAAWAFVVIVILVALDFRHAGAAALTMLPLVVGALWMVGALGVLGIPLNPANIMTLPLIVGIGVAYGIYVMQRYREDHDSSVFGKSTGRAVVLSGLTTVVGFGSLMIGKHQGIFTLGLVMSVGVLACLIAALLLLPALLEIARRHSWRI